MGDVYMNWLEDSIQLAEELQLMIYIHGENRADTKSAEKALQAHKKKMKNLTDDEKAYLSLKSIGDEGV